MDADNSVTTVSGEDLGQAGQRWARRGSMGKSRASILSTIKINVEKKGGGSKHPTIKVLGMRKGHLG